jgi:hypothetical protein
MKLKVEIIKGAINDYTLRIFTCTALFWVIIRI